MLRDDLLKMGQQALKAARELATYPTEQRNNILCAMADELEARRAAVQKANLAEVDAARKTGLPEAMCDRLLLNDSRYAGMVQGLRHVAALPDPVGAVLSSVTRPNGLIIKKIRVPIGVMAIIYESRPNVTADAASLCLKSANAVILRGGSEAIVSNAAIVDALQRGGEKAGFPANAIQFVSTTDRDAVRVLVQLEGYVNLVIPRGGESLIRAVVEMARVPVLKHYKGVCHVFVDESADAEMALRICENAKCQRPGVCNAMETLLVHERIAQDFIPRAAALLKSRGVQLRGDDTVCSLVPDARKAVEQDWFEEYLDLILAVRVVPDVKTAVEHINTYGSQHTDAIVTQSKESERIFVDNVDSGVVCVNASTRFNDGGEFGMGAEMGISTDKLHARGPVGLEELTTYKYVVIGSGQVRS
jgi:glutamate-5-semialdehyde dehydrogenase